MKTYIELTLTSGEKIFVPLGHFFPIQGPRWVVVRLIGNTFNADVKETMAEIKQLIIAAEEE